MARSTKKRAPRIPRGREPLLNLYGGDRCETFTVQVEVIAWVRTFVGGPASGSQDFTLSARDGETLREVLKHFSKEHPQLDAALWDTHAPGQLGPHIEIIVNDAILGSAHTLDSTLQPDDRITLTGQYIGG